MNHCLAYFLQGRLVWDPLLFLGFASVSRVGVLLEHVQPEMMSLRPPSCCV
jgi:hypothetical protein